MTKIKVNPDLKKYELARLFGGGHFRRLSPSTERKIDRLEAAFTEIIRPSLYYRLGKIISIDKGSVHLEEGLRLNGPKLSKSLNNCTELIFFIATIGKRV
ncbi:MAG: hypothetical protein ABII06_21060, partial [Pseudomonadota bacterium]